MSARRNRPLSGTTFKSPPAYLGPASDDGERSLVDGRNETQQLPADAGAETPVGKGATGRYGDGSGLDLTSDRTPFLSAAKAYLEDVRPYYRPLTREQMRRDLNTIDRDLRALKREGFIATTNPQRLTEPDVGKLILRWQTRLTRYGKPLDQTTQAHYLNTLGNLLGWCGNPVLDVMRRRRHVRFPRQVPKPIAVLDGEDLKRLRRSADAIPAWDGSTARFLVAFLPGTGLRPKEIRLARLTDLDPERWTLTVAHPKGEGSWAAAGAEAPILPFARDAVRDFLDERRAFLAGEDHEALIPYRRFDGTLDYWPAAMLRKLKAEIARLSGVRFSLKTFRATFAQMAKDRHVPIESVSRAMRHGSTKTTERFYARIRAEDAFRELERAFETPEVRAVPKTSRE